MARCASSGERHPGERARDVRQRRARGARRGGRALLAGLVRCHRCGRMLQVTYGGHHHQARYSCRTSKEVHGLQPCVTVGASRPDATIAHEVVLAVEPVAIEAAFVAEMDAVRQFDERQRALELERQQAAYEVSLAARRYESVDPDNRLVAAELETCWNAAIARLRECDERLAATGEPRGACRRDPRSHA
jgi:recombinase-like zinc beta ribbon protein